MKRRSFFGMLVGLPVLPFVDVKQPDIPEYTYDWSDLAHTDDPRFYVLGHGEYAPLVFLNGRIINDSGLRVVRCKSGRNGWIEYFRRGSHCGYVLNAANDALVRDRIYGVVEVKELAYETTNLTSGKRRTWVPVADEVYEKRAVAYAHEKVQTERLPPIPRQTRDAWK